MTMLSRLREKRTGSFATAIPAISATQPKGEPATVARIATVAVANPEERKTAPIPDDLENLIRRAGTYWEYSPEDYDLVRDLARRDPDGLRRALESDKWLAMAEWEAFEERAAIMEYDGGLSREEAERQAAGPLTKAEKGSHEKVTLTPKNTHGYARAGDELGTR